MTLGEVTFVRVCEEGSRTSERTGRRPLPKQGRLKDVTSGLLSLRRAGAGPCELSNQGSRRNRTCGRRAVDGGDCVPSLLSGRGSRPLSLS